jgi:hypothetical protein
MGLSCWRRLGDRSDCYYRNEWGIAADTVMSATASIKDGAPPSVEK